MRETVLRAAEAAGRSPDEIVCNYNMGVRVGGRANDERVVAGEPDAVIERLVTFVRAGFTSLSLWPIGDEGEQLSRLAEEIVPHVRAAGT
jgi:alkanesulfonate monooxygenase SsuD/methylene tetrahydromethanopterin reductase-like flavin-dependent oxidoreductase (luciferase family)